MMGAGGTTSLYEKMRAEGILREQNPQIVPAGRSIVVPLQDSSARDIQPEIYFPLPATPANERRYRRISHDPGEVHVHYGLKDQRLPGEGFRYGCRGVRGATTEETMKAGQLMGVAEYKNSVAECKYASVTREPLGRGYVRGHNVKMLPEGHGNPSGVPVDGKKVIMPVDAPEDPEEAHALYRRTHNNFHPGERIARGYSWPDAVQEPTFRFGQGLQSAPEGEGARMAFNMDVDDLGDVRKTRMVQHVCEDFRNVQHPKLGQKVHAKQGARHPDTLYGVKSNVSDYTAESCIKGYYSLKEQLPDQDLGHCTKPGRRNVTTETRAFGIPSVRTDIRGPAPGKRSLADTMAYGDECGAAALLSPQRFDMQGVPDREFLVRRPKEELASLIESVPIGHEVDFEAVWDEAVNLFDDGRPLVSLDAVLYIHAQHVDGRVNQKLSSTAPFSAAPVMVA